MRQRNDTSATWTFAATPATDDHPEQPAHAVHPGEATDHPVLLDGWTAVDDEPQPQAADDKQPKAAARKRTADDDSKGGEPK